MRGLIFTAVFMATVYVLPLREKSINQTQDRGIVYHFQAKEAVASMIKETFSNFCVII